MSTSFQPLLAFARHKDPLLAAGIHAALMAAPGIEVVAASDGLSFPDAQVVICDYETGIAWAQHGRHCASGAREGPAVVVITWRESEADVRTALQCGIGGYLLASCCFDELVCAVRAVGRGSPYLCKAAATLMAKSLTRTPLTMRESEILKFIASGMSNKLIASELGIALGTVKAHARTILDKLGARSRTQATVIGAQRGLLGADSPLRPTALPAGLPAAWLPQRRHHEPDRIAA
ncbi:LuxR C-terminal-related transcriptional regulator [Paucibacter sp. M5-1]|uniref:LuxR C-terminal-related transcriptional regulator n=1 Tax=Paucibacter sp. M5-1 TaxID=3015998 RepID=UPI0022B863D6|nr:response regulator transcription factor [Paucibacter sp. M5-1]MCZ7880489.1 response regulator transcription factor [Paucibacter sp. M5-1]